MTEQGMMESASAPVVVAKQQSGSCESSATGGVSLRTSSGSVRVGAPPPNTPQMQQQQKEAAKRELEAQLAALQQRLKDLEPVKPAETVATETETTAEATDHTEETSPAHVDTVHDTGASSLPSVSVAPSSPPTSTALPAAAAAVVDLTEDSPTTTGADNDNDAAVTSASKPSKKRKANVEDASAAVTASASSDAAAAAAASPTVADAGGDPTPKKAKKAAASSGSKKKETAEERDARKAADRALRAAELEAKKAEKQRESDAKKAEKQREAEEKKEAHRREVEEKKAEKQREADAKKAEADAKRAEKDAARSEKQKEIDAKREARAAEAKREEEAKEAAKKSLEKSKGIMSSFFGIKSPAPAPASAAAAAVAPAASTTDAAAAPAATGAGATADTTTPSPKPAVSSVDRDKDRLSRQAVFLPYAPDRRHWSAEHGRLAQEVREQQAKETKIDFNCSGEARDTILDWASDPARIQRARDACAKRRARIAAMAAATPTGSDRKKLLQFHDNYRPAWFGRMKKSLVGEVPGSAAPAAAVVSPVAVVPLPPMRFLPVPRCRRPTARWSVDPSLLNYEYDSEDDWGEEPDDAEELASEDGEDEDSDVEGDIRGDGLEEDGWLVPEDQDPLAHETRSGKDALKSKGRVREVMVPLIVGPVMDLDRIARRFEREQARRQADPSFVGTVVLTDDMKELMMYKKRLLVNAPIDFDPTHAWRLPAAEVLAATAPTQRRGINGSDTNGPETNNAQQSAQQSAKHESDSTLPSADAKMECDILEPVKVDLQAGVTAMECC